MIQMLVLVHLATVTVASTWVNHIHIYISIYGVYNYKLYNVRATEIFF